eukprot:Hpha_TRINITY_DN15731_c0_g1::TRINITY_DN15731_c0_g1_i1::g.39646::m.39646
MVSPMVHHVEVPCGISNQSVLQATPRSACMRHPPSYFVNATAAPLPVWARAYPLQATATVVPSPVPCSAVPCATPVVQPVILPPLAVAVVVPPEEVVHDHPNVDKSAGLPPGGEPDLLSDSDPPPLVEDSDDGLTTTVVVLAGLPVDTDVKPLLEETSKHFGVAVTRHLAVWNKGVILAEFERPVGFPKQRELVGKRMQVSPSTKPRVCLLPPSNTLSVRVFFLDPELNYEGTPEQVERYARVTRGWAEVTASLPNLRPLIEKGGGEVCEQVIAPRQARRVTTHLTARFRRFYVQIVVRYTAMESASSASERIDGWRDSLDGLRVVVRAEYARLLRNDWQNQG